MAHSIFLRSTSIALRATTLLGKFALVFF